MEKRRLGKTGYNATILTLGGFGPGNVSQEEAEKAIELALSHGINMVDVAPTYGVAEKHLSKYIQKYRSKLFVSEKTAKRTKDEAWQELQQSLKTLGTDYFDLYQFHMVGNKVELDQVLGKGGALEAFQEAKETGLIKFIGLSGHADITVHLEAIERYEFDTLLLPVNAGAFVCPDPVNDYQELLEKAQGQDIGVIAIKAVTKGRWPDKSTRDKYKHLKCWYQPLEDAEEIKQAIRFTLSNDGVTTYSMTGALTLWPKIIAAAENYKKMTEEEKEQYIQHAKVIGIKPLFPE